MRLLGGYVELKGSAVDQELAVLITSAKALAKRYKTLTGRPLGITGEVAEYETCAALGLQLADVRQAGYDAVAPNGMRYQIKARCLSEKPNRGQRMGSIQLAKPWDAVLLALLDGDFELQEIYEAGRQEVTDALLAPGSKARNERGALSVSKFKSIGRRVWKRQQ